MSNHSEGPGWWMTSDGKWYPPHLHPAVIESSTASQRNGDETSAEPMQSDAEHYAGSEKAAWPPPPSMPPMPPPPTIGYPPGYGPPPSAMTYAGLNVRIDPALNLPLAPWWKRLIAIIIDNVVLFAGFFLVALIAIAPAGLGNNNSGATTNQPVSTGTALLAELFIVVLLAIPAAVYFGLMNGSKRGQTLGKMALGIAVRDARSGASIGFWRAVGRYLIVIVFELLLFVPYIIDNLNPLWDRRRQAWHDKVSGTVVVDLKP